MRLRRGAAGPPVALSQRELTAAPPGGEPVRWTSPTHQRRCGSPSNIRVGSVLSAIPPAAGWPVCVAVAPDGRRYVATQTAVYASGEGGLMGLLAGNTHEAGFADGPGVHARFGSIFDIECRGDGILLVADGENHCLRNITPDGEVHTSAGCPNQRGFRDGAAEVARFNLPCGIAWDRRRKVTYVADRGNNRIRVVTAAGHVQTVAGSGKAGLTDGHGLNANFDGPKGIAVDQLGNILVADVNNHCVRMLRQDNGQSAVVSTIVGASNGESGHADGEGDAARFKKPCDIEGSLPSTPHVFFLCCAPYIGKVY